MRDLHGTTEECCVPVRTWSMHTLYSGRRTFHQLRNRWGGGGVKTSLNLNHPCRIEKNLFFKYAFPSIKESLDKTENSQLDPL